VDASQIGDMRAYTERHLKFWKIDPVDRPLVIMVVGGWSPFLEAVQGADDREEPLAPSDLRPEEFVPYYQRLYEMESRLGDDARRASQPFPAIPWLEAIMGTGVRRAGPHWWSERPDTDLAGLARVHYRRDNPWAQKYLEFLDLFAERFPSRPTGQSVLRGPTDLLAAALGDEAAVMALIDEPKAAMRALGVLTDLFCEFVRHQWEHTPPFLGGQVIGQYELWAPGRVARLQEDAISLYSPGLYRRFVLPCDQRLCALTPYNLMHLHASCVHLLDVILANEGLGAVQMSMDEATPIEQVLPAYQAIQRAGKPLVAKGRFTLDDIAVMKRSLSTAGLCVQPVVDTEQEARETLPALMAW